MPDLVVCSGAKTCGDTECVHAKPHKKQIMEPDYTCALTEMDEAWCNISWSWNTCQVPTGNNEKESE